MRIRIFATIFEVRALTTDCLDYSRKERVFRVLKGEGTDRLGRAVNVFFIVLICLNVLAVILETDRTLREPNQFIFYSFLLFSTIVFTIEYAVRLWACTLDTRFQSPFWGRLRYALTPLALIDLITVIPFYLSLFVQDQPFVRVLRLLVVLRIFKLSRYHPSFDILATVLSKKRWELFATVVIAATLLIVLSTLMYLIEGPVQPDKFGSIPNAMWWGTVTLTTVGYGNVYPITAAGKVLASLTAFVGIGFFALPTAILGSGFYEEFQTRKRKSREPSTCPHCGKIIDEEEA
jgi:voltage-gated potassium channel